MNIVLIFILFFCIKKDDKIEPTKKQLKSNFVPIQWNKEPEIELITVETTLAPPDERSAGK
jgi:hypothetical protein